MSANTNVQHARMELKPYSDILKAIFRFIIDNVRMIQKVESQPLAGPGSASANAETPTC